MNKEHLMTNAKLFAYETSKYFSSPERLLNYYTCKDEVVVISTKRLYVYYFNGFIDVKDALLTSLKIENTHSGVIVNIRGKEFDLVFESLTEKHSFMKYFEEYSVI